MKTKIFLSAILTLSPVLCALSQIPQGFNYQAIARDASGNPIVNTAMPVRITIQSEQTGGTIFWQELHSSVTTNDFGMLTLVVGQGTREAGTAATFADIDWSVTPKYIKTEIDYGGWKDMGVSPLWSVPFAMRANSSASEKWLQAGANIYHNAGKVGIWTSNPLTALTITENNNTGITYPLYIQNASGDWTATEKGVGLKFGRLNPTSGHDYGTIMGTIASNNGGAGRLQFIGGGGTVPHMTIDYTGNVGIGTTSPSAKLHVNGTIAGDMLLLGSAVQTTLRFTKTDNEVDQRITEFMSYGTGFVGRFVNDAYTAASPWLTVTRNPGTYTVNSVLISADNFGVGTSLPTGRAEIQAPGTWPDDVPLFQVKNKLGVPVLAVYNNGVKILVEDTDGKGVKGGFAIGGFDPTKAPGAETVNLLTVSPDSVRINIDNNPAKAVKGGFAIGSFDASKAVNPKAFMNVTPQASATGQYNTFLGYQSGNSTQSTGIYNTFIGYQAGYSNISADNNTFIGYQAGFYSKGPHNTYIGFNAGKSAAAGSSSAWNIFIGEGSGMNNSGGYETFTLFFPWGGSTTEYRSWGGNNVAIGAYTGVNLTGDFLNKSYGNSNVMVGHFSGYSLVTGYANTIIGTDAGKNLVSGHHNVFLGYGAGGQETGSNKLYIANSNTTTPLIYGDFNLGILTVHGSQTISSPVPELLLYTQSGAAGRKSAVYLYGTFGPGATDLTARNFATIEVGSTNTGWTGAYFRVLGRVNDGAPFETMKINTSNGDFYVSSDAYKPGGGSWLNSSDGRLKDLEGEFTGGLNEILNLNPSYFRYKNGNARNHSSEKEYIGFVAQDVQRYLPDAVSTGEDGYLNLDMHVINVALVNAVKEQQKIIESQKEELESLKERLSVLEAMMGRK